MWPSSSRRRLCADRRGTTTLEFGLVGGMLLMLMIGGIDLGRFYLTQHSLSTLLNEGVRATYVQCFAKSSCTLSTANATAAWGKVPFLSSAMTGASLTASQAAGSTTGSYVITASASYPFKFYLAPWVPDNGTLTVSTTFNY
jgi:Flp pilus assembly protein TadG